MKIEKLASNKISFLNTDHNEVEFLEIFEKTRVSMQTSDHQYQTIRMYNEDSLLRSKNQTQYKDYPFLKKIKIIPDESLFNSEKISDTLSRRSAVRHFSVEPISFSHLSNLLKYGAGVNNKNTPYELAFLDSDLQKRYVPSGGARFPIETYVVVNHCEGIDPGLYHFNVKFNALEKIKAGVQTEKLKELYTDETINWDCVGAVFIWTSLFQRTFEKYGLKTMRIMCYDMGHMAQTFWLNTIAMNLAGLSYAGGQDRAVNKYLQLNPNKEPYMLSFIVGRPLK